MQEPMNSLAMNYTINKKKLWNKKQETKKVFSLEFSDDY
jgi:hypothetical protein